MTDYEIVLGEIADSKPAMLRRSWQQLRGQPRGGAIRPLSKTFFEKMLDTFSWRTDARVLDARLRCTRCSQDSLSSTLLGLIQIESKFLLSSSTGPHRTFKNPVIVISMRRENELGELSNYELLERLETMSSSERLLGAAIVEHLCEVEERALHLDIGFRSLYQYCTDQLGFSADVAYKRAKVARAAAAHPQILEHLETGELSLSSVVVIASHLNVFDDAEGDELVEAARGKSKREAERMIAERVPDAVPPRGSELRFHMSERFEELLREARDLEGVHDAAAILEKALKKFVEVRKKQRFAQTDRPHAQARMTTTDGIPNRVKREVYLRDGGVCSFVGESHLGTRQCDSTHQLEYDHVIPRALGGESTVDNLRLLCRNHNQRAAEQVLGKDCVQEARARARLSRDNEAKPRRRHEA